MSRGKKWILLTILFLMVFSVSSPLLFSPKGQQELTATSGSSAEPDEDRFQTSPPKETDAPLDLHSPHSFRYGERCALLVSEMIDAYRKQEAGWEDSVFETAEKLKQEDPLLGETWEQIIAYWDFVNTEMDTHAQHLPEGLPTDDSLCIVVLGFQLAPDGEMLPELLGRCQLALEAAKQYPHSYILVTGGGTAYKNPEKTEAGVMADWFVQKGIAEDRLILETASLSTSQNARYSFDILSASYPQVKHLVIVTSDYHLPLGCLMFTEAALLYSCEHGELPYTVYGGLGFPAPELAEYASPMGQASYVRSLADLWVYDGT